MSDVTRELILEAVDHLDRAIAAPDPHTVPPPDFIEAMSDRQLCEWDLAVYRLALEALDGRHVVAAAYSHCDFADSDRAQALARAEKAEAALAEVDTVLNVVGADREFRRLMLCAMRDRLAVVEAEVESLRGTVARAIDRLMPALVELDRGGKIEAGFVRQQVAAALEALGVDVPVDTWKGGAA